MNLYDFQAVKFKSILDIPALGIERTGVTTLFGPSGSGKTTLLRLLNKMISPTEGKILYGGNDLAGVDSVELRRQVSMLTQTPPLFEGTVRDNLVAGLRYQKREVPEDDVLQQILHQVRLEQRPQDDTAHLSGGEKQRLALGRLLLLDAPVFLLDEPSSALDEETAEEVVKMLVDTAREKDKTLVMVTHSAEIAQQYSNRIVHVEAGRIVKQEVLG